MNCRIMAPYLPGEELILKVSVKFPKYTWQMSAHEDEAGGGLALQEAKPELKQPPLFKVVLMNDDYEAFEIYEIDRETLTDNIVDKNSKKAKKGAMTVARFKKISTLAWSRDWGSDVNNGEETVEKVIK